jgi:hypothetical protein
VTAIDWSALPPPQPEPDVDTAPFWDATAHGQLLMCRCLECRHSHQPPLERCRRCGGETAFEPISGHGTVYTFIVQRQPAVVGYSIRSRTPSPSSRSTSRRACDSQDESSTSIPTRWRSGCGAAPASTTYRVATTACRCGYRRHE